MKNFLFLLIFLASGFAALQAQECKQACDKFTSCTVDFWTKKGRAVTASEKTTLVKGCMQTCEKRKEQTLACYNRSVKQPNSCQSLHDCITAAAR
jgi:Cys-rich protein (TIGR04453 family)